MCRLYRSELCQCVKTDRCMSVWSLNPLKGWEAMSPQHTPPSVSREPKHLEHETRLPNGIRKHIRRLKQQGNLNEANYVRNAALSQKNNPQPKPDVKPGEDSAKWGCKGLLRSVGGAPFILEKNYWAGVGSGVANPRSTKAVWNEVLKRGNWSLSFAV